MGKEGKEAEIQGKRGEERKREKRKRRGDMEGGMGRRREEYRKPVWRFHMCKVGRRHDTVKKTGDI